MARHDRGDRREDVREHIRRETRVVLIYVAILFVLLAIALFPDTAISRWLRSIGFTR